MNKLFAPFIFIAAHAFGQIEVSGRIVDVYNEPIQGVNVVVKDLVLAISDSKGKFRLRIAADSTELFFRLVGYTGQRMKFKESKTIEVKLRETGDDPVWKLGNNKKPLSKETNSLGTVTVYAIAEFDLRQTRVNSKVVVWHVEDNKVFLPLDSLVEALKSQPRGDHNLH